MGPGVSRSRPYPSRDTTRPPGHQCASGRAAYLERPAARPGPIPRGLELIPVADRRHGGAHPAGAPGLAYSCARHRSDDRRPAKQECARHRRAARPPRGQLQATARRSARPRGRRADRTDRREQTHVRPHGVVLALASPARCADDRTGPSPSSTTSRCGRPDDRRSAVFGTRRSTNPSPTGCAPPIGRCGLTTRPNGPSWRLAAPKSPRRTSLARRKLARWRPRLRPTRPHACCCRLAYGALTARRTCDARMDLDRGALQRARAPGWWGPCSRVLERTRSRLRLSAPMLTFWCGHTRHPVPRASRRRARVGPTPPTLSPRSRDWCRPERASAVWSARTRPTCPGRRGSCPRMWQGHRR